MEQNNFLQDIKKVADKIDGIEALAGLVENGDFTKAIENINRAIEILNNAESIGNAFALNWLGQLKEIPPVEQSSNGDSFSHKHTNILYSFLNGAWKTILVPKNGIDGVGKDGKSAYEIAISEGYGGTVIEWLNMQLGKDGKSAYEIAVEDGFVGTVTEWLATFGANGEDGDSAYEVAVEDGFVGTVTEWLATFGANGEDGKSAYEVAVNDGFEGTVTEWLATFGENGRDGKSAYEVAVEDGFVGTVTEWLATFGANGEDGDSAYEVAVEDGFEGTVTEWLDSLVGGGDSESGGISEIPDYLDIKGFGKEKLALRYGEAEVLKDNIGSLYYATLSIFDNKVYYYDSNINKVCFYDLLDETVTELFEFDANYGCFVIATLDNLIVNSLQGANFSVYKREDDNALIIEIARVSGQAYLLKDNIFMYYTYDTIGDIAHAGKLMKADITDVDNVIYTEMVASTPYAYGSYGSQADIDYDNNRIYVGDGFYSDTVENGGCVDIYDLDGTKIDTIESPSPIVDESFGLGVYFFDEIIVVESFKYIYKFNKSDLSFINKNKTSRCDEEFTLKEMRLAYTTKCKKEGKYLYSSSFNYTLQLKIADYSFNVDTNDTVYSASHTTTAEIGYSEIYNNKIYANNKGTFTRFNITSGSYIDDDGVRFKDEEGASNNIVYRDMYDDTLKIRVADETIGIMSKPPITKYESDQTLCKGHLYTAWIFLDDEDGDFYDYYFPNYIDSVWGDSKENDTSLYNYARGEDENIVIDSDNINIIGEENYAFDSTNADMQGHANVTHDSYFTKSIGDFNLINNTSYIFALGMNNIVHKTERSLVVGYENKVGSHGSWCNYALVCGEYNKVRVDYTFTCGEELENQLTDYKTVLGKNNIDKADNIFEIGNGTYSERKNIFEIKTNGDVYSDGVKLKKDRITAGTTEQRPSLTDASGDSYLDTDLIKPIWWTGDDWIDSTGTVV